MKTGLFGGAFDPFHNGHLAICRAAVKSAGLDRMIIIPSGKAPHKSGFSASFEDRCAMVEAALAGTGFEVSRYEGERGEVSYSATTVEDFHSMYPEDELFFLIGADSYRDFHKWYQPWRITDIARLVVFPRGGIDIEVQPPAILADMEKIEISSTVLREKIKAGEDVKGDLPPAVDEYIGTHNLYK